MNLLTQAQKNQFWRDGVLVLENAVDTEQLTRLRAQFSAWVQESRGYSQDYGETLDGRPCFDLQPGHNNKNPAAEDAIELSENHLPSQFTHELIRGEASGRVRCVPYEMALPAVSKATSFFAQQEGADA